jgi:hypothetical protein
MAVALVFLLQLALIVVIGNAPTVVKENPRLVPAYHMGDPRPADLVALEDPALFVLPHAKGFSGGTWMKAPPLEFQPRRWSESPRLLSLSRENLGEIFAKYLQVNAGAAFQTVTAPEPLLTFPVIAPSPRLALESNLRIEGELAQRRLLNPGPLPPVVEASTNSVVEVTVSPQGYVFSAVLSARSAGTNDQLALHIARSKRFEPIDSVGPDRPTHSPAPMMQGTLIFEWRPSQRTNNTVSSSPDLR